MAEGRHDSPALPAGGAGRRVVSPGSPAGSLHMPWIQAYTPIGGAGGPSALVAAIPLGVIFVCLAALRMKAHHAAMLALVVHREGAPPSTLHDVPPFSLR